MGFEESSQGIAKNMSFRQIREKLSFKRTQRSRE